MFNMARGVQGNYKRIAVVTDDRQTQKFLDQTPHAILHKPQNQQAIVIQQQISNALQKSRKTVSSHNTFL